MGWAQQFEDGSYRACWRVAGKQRSKSGFSRKAAAERYAGEQESRAQRGEASYAGRSATWGAWCDRWLELRRVERSTDASDQTRIERWLRPRWGGVQLVRIEAEHVQIWVNELDQAMAPASVAKVYYLFSASMKAAVRHKRLAVSPCTDIDLPEVPPPDERFLTWEEFWAAAYHLDQPYKAGAIVLVGTGMRFGEMAGLHRHRIHPAEQTIEVFETWDGVRVKAYPKGRKKRTVPLPSWVAEALEQLPASTARSCGLAHIRGNACRSDLLMRGPRDAPLDAGNMLQRHWSKALVLAKVDPARQHDLRHTYASWLIQAGRPLAEIAELLGQTDVSVARRYAHLAGTHIGAARAVLEGRAVPFAASVPHDLPARPRLRAL